MLHIAKFLPKPFESVRARDGTVIFLKINKGLNKLSCFKQSLKFWLKVAGVALLVEFEIPSKLCSHSPQSPIKRDVGSETKMD